MKFYEIDNALIEAIEAGDKPVRVRIQIDFTGDGSFESVFEQDILEVDFYGLKESVGGTSARGDVLLKGVALLGFNTPPLCGGEVHYKLYETI
jgi:hypothetical protein